MSDESVLMPADILPTSYEVGIRNGKVSPGDTVAVIGAGPIGLAAITTAGLLSPSHIIAVDLAASRLKLVRPGGHVANIGVHGKPATLHLEDLWLRNLTITTGLVDTCSTPTLLRMLASGRLDATRFITHRFGLHDMAEAYEAFAHPEQTGALKVVLHRQ